MTTCDKCGVELHIGDFPFCPHGRGTGLAIGDECDVLVRHGLCHEDGTPRRFRSKAEMKRVADSKGLVNFVRHTDGDKHVSRWI